MSNIGVVIEGMKQRRFYRRPSWPTLTHIGLNGEIIEYYSVGVTYTWTPSHPDLLAEDWYECIPDR